MTAPAPPVAELAARATANPVSQALILAARTGQPVLLIPCLSG